MRFLISVLSLILLPCAIFIYFGVKFFINLHDERFIDGSSLSFFDVLFELIVLVWFSFAFIRFVIACYAMSWRDGAVCAISILIVLGLWKMCSFADLARLAVMYPSYEPKLAAGEFVTCWDKVDFSNDPADPRSRILVYDPKTTVDELNQRFSIKIDKGPESTKRIFGSFYILTIFNDDKYCPLAISSRAE